MKKKSVVDCWCNHAKYDPDVDIKVEFDIQLEELDYFNKFTSLKFI